MNWLNLRLSIPRESVAGGGIYLSQAMNVKPCVSCGIEKTLENYDIQINNSDGRTNRCKPCRSLNNKIRYSAKKNTPPAWKGSLNV